MIRKIWLREYGPFREAEFSLSPLTVLVGPNASGKTMAMEALLRVKGVLDEATADIYRRDESQPDPEALERVTRKFFRSYGRMTPTHENRFIAFDRGSCFVFSERGKTPPRARGSSSDRIPGGRLRDPAHARHGAAREGVRVPGVGRHSRRREALGDIPAS